MGRGRIPPCDAINATKFHRFFDAKVDGVRATTANAPPPSFSTVPPGCSLHAFQSLVVEDVVAAVHALPDKQSADDPLPTRLLKENRRSSTISRRIAQSESANWLGADIVQVSIHHAASEERQPRLGRPRIISSNRQSVGPVEAARASRRSAARQLPERGATAT